MKRFVFVLLLFIFILNFSTASVEVHNYTLDLEYSPFENITGEINLTIVDEEYDLLITSNDDDEISLGDFLSNSGSLFECSPPDCSNDYSFSGRSSDKSFDVSVSENSYLGFVLSGEDIVIQDLSFSLESDFGVSSNMPLGINFFEDESWRYSAFSSELLNKDWGCYDVQNGFSGPFIGSVEYCEMISVPDTGAIRVGVVVDGEYDVDLDMTVYPETGVGASWGCSYNPSVDGGCIVSPEVGDIFSAGDYQVCVSADASVTNYSIYKEEIGDTCGFIHSDDPEDSNKDYAIFAQGVKYGDASLLDSVDFVTEDIIDAANKLINERYEGDCSDGCVLPLEFFGTSQSSRIYDIELTFTEGGEIGVSRDIYDLDIVPVTVDFSGVVDLVALGFNVSKDMEYEVSLGSYDLFSGVVSVLPAPTISSVLPLNPPAGVPIRFYSVIDFNGSGPLSYNWDFGDGLTEVTEVPYVLHAYSDLGSYSLELEVSAGGDLKSKRSFGVNVISPQDAVINDLVSRRNSLESVAFKISKYPPWYKDALSKIFRIDFFMSELDRLDRKLENSFVAEDFVDIAKELYVLEFPVFVRVETTESPYLFSRVEDVDIEPVETIGGLVSGATNEVYAKPILNWQNLNVEASFVLNEFSSVSDLDSIDEVFSVYDVDVKMKDDYEAYFVINRPFNELYFKEDVGQRKAGNATVIILDADSENSFSFYYESGEPTTFFVSPRLSSIVIEENIDTTCNFNFVCEENLGENPNTCRSDCKPVGRAVVYVFLSLFFVFVFYTLLQVWYKYRYESFLFKDRRQMYNLLMYVTNARARGMNDDRIAAELRSQGWSSERVNYIIKKSIGKRTGLYEIIPVEKVMAFFRNRAAKKRVGVATDTQQQIGRNINKYRFPRRV